MHDKVKYTAHVVEPYAVWGMLRGWYSSQYINVEKHEHCALWRSEPLCGPRPDGRARRRPAARVVGTCTELVGTVIILID